MTSDPIHSVLTTLSKVVSHNRYLVVAMVLVAGLFSYTGCQGPTTTTTLSEKPQTSEQLSTSYNAKITGLKAEYASNIEEMKRLVARNDEIETTTVELNEEMETAFADLRSKSEKQLGLINTIAATASTFLGPAASGIVGTILPVALGALGIGAVVDNRRKDGIIKKSKSTPAA